jgi:hypothetical protein
MILRCGVKRFGIKAMSKQQDSEEREEVNSSVAGQPGNGEELSEFSEEINRRLSWIM